MLNDEQTHKLPLAAATRDAVRALAGYADGETFERDVARVRRCVHGIYSDLFATEERLSGEAGNLVFTGVDDDPGTVATLQALGFSDPLGLQAAASVGSAGGFGGLGALGGAGSGAKGGYDPRTDTFTPTQSFPIPNLLKPDKCPPENDCDKLNDDVQRAKDNVGKFLPAACNSDMSKLEILSRSSAWLELAVARAKRDQRCWAGGDAGHQQAQADAWANLGRCQRLLR